MIRNPLAPLGLLSLACALVAGCAAPPAGSMSASQLKDVRAGYGSVEPGMPKAKALEAFPKANKVKLGASTINGAQIEEWKIEAFHDSDKQRDLFVAFLYFCNDSLADSSDTRIDYRSNVELIERWCGGAG